MPRKSDCCQATGATTTRSRRLRGLIAVACVRAVFDCVSRRFHPGFHIVVIIVGHPQVPVGFRVTQQEDLILRFVSAADAPLPVSLRRTVIYVRCQDSGMFVRAEGCLQEIPV